MIDVPRCKDPAYGKIHVGLYLSILQDAIERSELGKEQAPAPEKKSHKRQRGDTTSASTKRPRTRSAVIKEKSVAEEERKLHQIAKGELAKCPLLLLQIRHGIYNSPTPASFQRVNSIRRSTPYGPDEYFSIVVTSKLASGATGTVHRAYLEFLPPDGEERRLDVVLKLSFEAEQVKRLRHEFAVYEHLAMRGVTQGIPVVYGLFEGPDTDAVALVMSHVGNALVKLTRDPQYDKVLSDTARDGFLRVVQTIHAAGVRHRDIRPENLTVLADDQVSVIDFDMAELHPSEGAKRRELRHLEELLEGRYYPPNLIPSADTTPERPGPGIRRAAPESGLDFVEEELGD
ncbi:hypothetical protein DXG03_002077 [Asterophora parasitica]|uniref:Protein kinase domain-containing protein n=1 Tax=Asterophora parasitica TaxID=117018 RepID=A0A9P7G3A9_9AGAR|nr:hypothetical protein DXG03_002077 [Asterophora parasitica]